MSKDLFGDVIVEQDDKITPPKYDELFSSPIISIKTSFLNRPKASFPLK